MGRKSSPTQVSLALSSGTLLDAIIVLDNADPVLCSDPEEFSIRVLARSKESLRMVEQEAEAEGEGQL